MKFLIENYANHFDTQSLYFHKALSEMNQYESVMWDNSFCSIYDILDREQPDYYITNAYRLTKDFAHYVSNNKKIQLILNVDYMSEDLISGLEKSVIDSGIDCCFFFSSKKMQTKSVRFVHMNNAFDNNLQNDKNKITYKIPKAIVVNSEEEITQRDGVYHTISNNEKLREKVDIVLPENMMFSLYKNYDEVIFAKIENFITQSFFDALHQCNKVYYEYAASEVEESIRKIFKLEGNVLDYNNESRLDNFESIKSIVEEKHRPINRIKTILSQIPRRGE
jgi:hypothetical protein